jgi:tRNA pseudouridine55 synthase
VSSGLLVVDKPAGPTSHDAVDRVRRALGERRVGHAGTLDPFATGVLPVCVGPATRLVRFLSDSDKEYEAEVRLGFATSTDDATGEPLGPDRAVDVAPERVAEACRSLTGLLEQVPPAFSAKRQGGRRLYELARQGVAVERRPAAVTVHELGLLAVAGGRLRLRVRCSRGTYVRALARDLGERLGTGGHLAALRRTRVGHLALEQAVEWERPETWAERLLPAEAAVPDLPRVVVGEAGEGAIRHGRPLDLSLVESGFPDGAGGPVGLYGRSGRLLAVAERTGFEAPPGLPAHPRLQPRVVLCQ